MITYKCRKIIPIVSNWFEIKSNNPSEAAQDYFFENSLATSSLSYRYTTKENKVERITFAVIEVEGFGEFITRMFHYGITRKGVVRPPRYTLTEIAKILGFDEDPQNLLSEGWDLEETFVEAALRSSK